MVLGCLHGSPLKEHYDYFGRHKRPPLRPPNTPTREDGLFAALRRAVPKPKARESWKNAWISATMWRLVKERVSARRDPTRDQTLIWRLSRTIKSSLKGDRSWRAEYTVKEVERLLGLDPPLHWEAWHWMKEWYWDAVDHAPPPARVTLEQIMAERVEL